ncbi:MAG: shikimate dehydrogenase [Candidatus Dadabacteria bacterium]|nr:shikimate dehydrogenase [Candidatus Dadabacteria bacterium]
MKISGATKVYGIFGHPVSHSFSPAMHNAAFEALGLDCVYVAFDVQPKDLEASAGALRTMSVAGINVTVPHKESVIPFLDTVSQEAELVGAVNTVKNDGGVLKGYNTDVGGFLRALKEDIGCEPGGMRVALLGAGGAARAVLTALCMNGAREINVINRTVAKAQGLADEFQNSFEQIVINAHGLANADSVESCLAGADLLVNCTSAGMKGVESLALPLEALGSETLVYDLVYNPLETELVAAARRRGNLAETGLSMLLYQGAESFEIWTGARAPVEVMKQALSF